MMEKFQVERFKVCLNFAVSLSSKESAQDEAARGLERLRSVGSMAASTTADEYYC
jgi:hypothetical protein